MSTLFFKNFSKKFCTKKLLNEVYKENVKKISQHSPIVLFLFKIHCCNNISSLKLYLVKNALFIFFEGNISFISIAFTFSLSKNCNNSLASP